MDLALKQKAAFGIGAVGFVLTDNRVEETGKELRDKGVHNG